MDVVEIVPTFEQYAFTFGGVAPLRRIAPGTALRLWSDDAFCGALRSTADLSSDKVDLRYVNPQTGPFYVEGAETGDTLAVRLDRLRPNRTLGRCAARLARCCQSFLAACNRCMSRSAPLWTAASRRLRWTWLPMR